MKSARNIILKTVVTSGFYMNEFNFIKIYYWSLQVCFITASSICQMYLLIMLYYLLIINTYNVKSPVEVNCKIIKIWLVKILLLKYIYIYRLYYLLVILYSYCFTFSSATLIDGGGDASTRFGTDRKTGGTYKITTFHDNK